MKKYTCLLKLTFPCEEQEDWQDGAAPLLLAFARSMYRARYAQQGKITLRDDEASICWKPLCHAEQEGYHAVDQKGQEDNEKHEEAVRDKS